MGHGEKGGGVESIAIDRGVFRQVLSPIPVPFGCFNAPEFLCPIGKVPFFTFFRVGVVPQISSLFIQYNMFHS